MERVARLSSEKPVLIFAASNDCPLGQMVTALFTDIGACAAVHALDKDPCGRDLERELARGAATIPAVFIGGKLVGSTNEIYLSTIY
jgi:glutaredoxin 3